MIQADFTVLLLFNHAEIHLIDESTTLYFVCCDYAFPRIRFGPG